MQETLASAQKHEQLAATEAEAAQKAATRIKEQEMENERKALELAEHQATLKANEEALVEAQASLDRAWAKLHEEEDIAQREHTASA